MRTPSAAWVVAFPQLQQGAFNFVFTSTLPVGEFGFEFKFFAGHWNCWVTLPSGEIRPAGVYPNDVSWTGFADYYIQFQTTLAAIGQNDLGSVSMVVFQL